MAIYINQIDEKTIRIRQSVNGNMLFDMNSFATFKASVSEQGAVTIKDLFTGDVSFTGKLSELYINDVLAPQTASEAIVALKFTGNFNSGGGSSGNNPDIDNLNAKEVAIWDGTNYIYVLLKDLDTATQGLASDTYVERKIADSKTSVFEFKGAVDTLPATANFGDIYRLNSDGSLHWWVGDEWRPFDSNIDLSAYYTASEVDSLIANEATARENADTALSSTLDNKVDKVTGKGLSTNDYTDADKSKLDALDTNSQNDNKYVKLTSANTQVIDSNIAIGFGSELLAEESAGGQQHVLVAVKQYDTYMRNELANKYNPTCLNHNQIATDGTDVGKNILVNYKNYAGGLVSDEIAYMSDLQGAYSAGIGIDITDGIISADVIDDSDFDSTEKALSAKRVGDIEVDQAVDKDKYVVVDVMATTDGIGYQAGDIVSINDVDVKIKEVDFRYGYSTFNLPVPASRYGLAADGNGKLISPGSGNAFFDVSTDNGITWGQIPIAGVTQRYGIATDGNGKWIHLFGTSTSSGYVSTDNGVTWSLLSFGSSGTRISIATDGKGTWITTRAGNIDIYDISIDNGVTWRQANFPSISVREGIATDGNGKWIVLRTGSNIYDVSTDNGVTWTPNFFSDVINRRYIATDGKGTWIVLRISSNVFDISTDDGVTWTQSSITLPAPVTTMCFSGGKWIFIGANVFRYEKNILAGTHLRPSNILEKYDSDPAGSNLQAAGGSGIGFTADITTSYSPEINGELIESTLRYVSASDPLIARSALYNYLYGLPEATPSASGLMSASDKSKLDNSDWTKENIIPDNSPAYLSNLVIEEWISEGSPFSIIKISYDVISDFYQPQNLVFHSNGVYVNGIIPVGRVSASYPSDAPDFGNVRVVVDSTGVNNFTVNLDSGVVANGRNYLQPIVVFKS